MNLAYACAWLAADKAQSKAGMKVETERKEDELDQLISEIAEKQKEVEDERAGYGFWSSIAGCAVGGTIGLVASGMNPMGAVAGCSLGSGLVSKAVDWAYDSEDGLLAIQTELEEELQDLEQDLKDIDMDLSTSSHKYWSNGASEWEDREEAILEQRINEYDTWEDTFYALEGKDYLLGMAGDIGSFVVGQVGGELLSNLEFGGSFAPDLCGTSYDVGYTSGGFA